MRTNTCAVVVLGLVFAAAAMACGSSSNDATPKKTSDAGADGASADGGPSASTYPAFKPDVGQLKMNGGPLITAPKLVTVTWSTDPNAAALESFDDKLGASDYWKSTVGEYGIGAATSGAANHVHVTTAAPATSTADELDTWLVAQVGNAASGWPAYDASTIYVIYIPTATQLTPSGAYHSETVVGANAHVPFVVIDENAHGTKSVLDAVTEAASHEIAETATNPRVLSTGADLGLVDFDAMHVAYQISTGDNELGDLCEGKPDSVFMGPADLPVALQRLWSNKSAAAGHNPCVPLPAEPYYNVTPLDLETVSVFVDTDATASSGLGFKIAIGAKKTIKVGFYSDAPVPGPWTITAVEGNFFSPESNHRLTIAVTQGSGKNGDMGTIDVTANAQSLGAGNAVLMTVTSQAAGLAPHSVPILIGTY